MIVSVDLVKRGLCERIDQLVPQLLPAARRDGAEWRVGSLNGEPGQSMAINRTAARAGVWQDFAAGIGGDVIDLVAATMCHGDVGEAIGWARRWLGLGDMTPEDRRRRERDAETARRAAARADEAERAKKAKSAQGLFLGGVPLAGTLGARYLAGRGIDLAAFPRQPGGVRFHPALRCWHTGQERPGLVACVNGADGAFQAVHRTLLHAHPDGSVTKAGVPEAKRSLGSVRGGFIPLWRGASGKPMREAPVGEWVTVSEGIEDGFSVACALPQMRVVAAVSLNNLANLSFPPAIAGVMVAAQNDEGQTARDALERAVETLARRLPVRVVRPPAGIKDWNDWTKALIAERAAERREAVA